ncbi:primase-helicase family protein [Bergeyella zoohelcum]|uniref:Uncharacterized protein n=1 Tax=Bergeyella zoohelcum ATCC 43767 TaxID=883096 RepID=K1M2H5_9FLAO|nr:primase-helicase family protein [Bergeyella zoohelcum]EKB56573.1 hypothetical protein HMPREF9699_01302 [Bergeyella zoohelcum ATCC 43767]SUV48519.1 Uncharacterised protein [Bergeyella zoohelcum]
MSFPINQDNIFQATNGGLDLITRFLPQARLNKHFKIRQEGTESANISKKDGVYFVKDWGDTGGFYSQSRNGIHIYAKEMGLTYFEALLQLGKELGILDDSKTKQKNISFCQFSEFQGELNEDGYCYEIKEFTDYELEVLGPLVTKEVCQKYGLYSLKSYSWLKKEESVQRELCKVYTVESSDTFPVFAFIVTEGGGKPKLSLQEGKPSVEQPQPQREWLKIYKPKSADKKYRFSYLGKKPVQHIFGLENAKSIYNALQNEIEYDEEGYAIEPREKKLERIVICSGDRDSLNMASTGEVVVWFNSETADITESQIGMLFKYAEEVVNVPDLDPTGYEAGKKLALEHIEVKTAWLPTELGKRKDFRGSPMKDFTDYMKTEAEFGDKEQRELRRKVKRLLELARPARFWTVKYKRNKEGKIVDGTPTYSVNYKNAFNFLKLNGFFRIKDPQRKEGYYFVQQTKHILREVNSQEIKDFFNVFLDKKQKEKGLRLFPDELLNMVIGTEAVSEKKLVNLETKEFDFTDYTPKSQYFFFDKFIWEVTKDKIERIDKGYRNYVMEQDILNEIIFRQTRCEIDSSKLTVEEPFFNIKKDDNGNWDLSILRKDCDFMNYLINASRVYWKEELKEVKTYQYDEYLNENKFIIDKHTLTDDQIYEQELHFINKVFCFGYMLHRYKDPSKAWCLYIMDNEVVDDNESHGRTGKSLFSSLALRLFMNSKYLGARKKGLLDSEFLYDGITEQTDYVLFDDADKRFQFQQLFTDITGDLNVNPKNQNAYLIPFYLSPKFCISTNYAPVGLDSSSKGRVLFMSFANWYHGEIDGFAERNPMHDFEHRLFSEWDMPQWNLFLNFSMQCLQFYLSVTEKIGAPEGNIRKRNLIAEIGVVFLEWAEDYFQNENVDNMVCRKVAYEHLKNYNKTMQNISSTAFKKKVQQFCELKGYIFNPADRVTDKSNHRIMAWHEGKTEEHFYIEIPKETHEDNEENDDLYG